MRKLYSFGIVCVMGSFVFTSLTYTALAVIIDLERPSVGFSKDYPRFCCGRVLAALNCEKCAFLGGTGGGNYTELLYRGKTQDLNSFLKGLANCPEVTVRVSFERPTEEKDAFGHVYDDSDWWVEHSAKTNEFHVKINLNSKQIDLEELHVPSIQTAKISQQMRFDEIFSLRSLRR